MRLKRVQRRESLQPHLRFTNATGFYGHAPSPSIRCKCYWYLVRRCKRRRSFISASIFSSHLRCSPDLVSFSSTSSVVLSSIPVIRLEFVPVRSDCSVAHHWRDKHNKTPSLINCNISTITHSLSLPPTHFDLSDDRYKIAK